MGFVESEELEKGAFILLELRLDFSLALGESLNTGVILPDESLKFSRSIGELRRGLGEDLLRIRLLHVVGHGLASLRLLVSLNERARSWVVLLKLEVSGGSVVAEGGGNSQVL